MIFLTAAEKELRRRREEIKEIVLWLDRDDALEIARGDVFQLDGRINDQGRGSIGLLEISLNGKAGLTPQGDPVFVNFVIEKAKHLSKTDAKAFVDLEKIMVDAQVDE